MIHRSITLCSRLTATPTHYGGALRSCGQSDLTSVFDTRALIQSAAWGLLAWMLSMKINVATSGTFPSAALQTVQYCRLGGLIAHGPGRVERQSISSMAVN